LTAAFWFALAAINLAAFAAFGIDKRRARLGKRRLRERTLLGLAALGGMAGAYLGRWRFRHKTRKVSFSAVLHLIAAGQLAILGWMFIRP